MAKVKIKVGKEDVEKSADAGDFEQAPPGMYVFELKEVNPGYTKGDDGKEDKSRPYLECIWKPIGSGREGAPLTAQLSQIWDYVSFGEASKWKMAQFALAVGLKVNAKGEIDSEIEIEEGKPGTIIGTKAIGRVKKDKDQEGNYRAKIGGLYNMDGAAAESGDDAFAEEGGDDAEEANDSPFGDDAGEVGEELWTEETLMAVEDLKALGEEAKAFDLTPQEFIVRKGKAVDQDATKAALVAAILEAQNGPADDGAAEEALPDDPF